MEQSYDNDEPSNGKKTLWIVGGIILAVMIIALIYGATQKSLRNPGAPETSKATPAATGSGSATTPGSSVLGADERVQVIPTIKGLEVVNLQTYPYKVQASVSGTVPEGCSTLDTPTVTLSGKVFTISATASRPKDAMCTEVVTPQSAVVDIPVDGLSPGKYGVKIGKITKTFTLLEPSTIQPSGDK